MAAAMAPVKPPALQVPDARPLVLHALQGALGLEQALPGVREQH